MMPSWVPVRMHCVCQGYELVASRKGRWDSPHLQTHYQNMRWDLTMSSQVRSSLISTVRSVWKKDMTAYMNGTWRSSSRRFHPSLTLWQRSWDWGSMMPCWARMQFSIHVDTVWRCKKWHWLGDHLPGDLTFLQPWDCIRDVCSMQSWAKMHCVFQGFELVAWRKERWDDNLRCYPPQTSIPCEIEVWFVW